MFNIYENPWGLLATAAGLLVVIWIARMFLTEKKYRWLYIIPVLTAAAAVGIDYFVETDLEQINKVINRGVAAFEKEDTDTIEKIISEDYSDSFHNNKASLMADIRAKFAEPFIEKGNGAIESIEIKRQNADVILDARIFFDRRSDYYEYKSMVQTKSRVELQKENGRWLVKSVELLEVDRQPFGWQKIRGY